MLWHLIIIAFCLFLSALFSGSETSLFSISKLALAQIKEARPKTGLRIERLLANPPRLLGTILLSNLAVNVIASTIFTLYMIVLVKQYQLAQALYLAIGSIVLTVLLLVFGDVIPKVIALQRPITFANFTSRIIIFLMTGLSPIVNLLSKLGMAVLRHTKTPHFPTDEELVTMIDIGKEQGAITGTEEEILHNLLELEKRTASEVMTPRIEIAGIARNMPCSEAVEYARKTGFSRLPVYEETIDNIVGVLYVKNLLTRVCETEKIDEIKRPVYFVPEVKNLSSLLEELRKQGSHIAIVVDEFGQTAGLVTLEDILESIFGEITDEYDLREDLPYFKLDDKTYLVDGDIDLRTLNRIFHRAFKDLKYARLSGFIHAHLKRLPEPGESFSYRKLQFEIKTVNKNRIEEVIIRKS